MRLERELWPPPCPRPRRPRLASPETLPARQATLTCLLKTPPSLSLAALTSIYSVGSLLTHITHIVLLLVGLKMLESGH